MGTLGFLSLNPAAENHYFTEIAKHSLTYNIDCYRFMPTSIDPVTHLVSGEAFQHDKQNWLPATFPIPTFLYDRCFYHDDTISKTSRSIVNWLKNREDLQFLGHGLPNKWRIHEALSSSPLKSYLPETKIAEHSSQVLAFLDKHKKIILKPISGSGGMGIACLEMNKGSISLLIEKQQKLQHTNFPERQTAAKWIEHLLAKKDYLIQPFLQLSDKLDRPFDIRVFLQKDGSGQWVKRAKAIRVGKKQGLLSNLRAGAETLNFQEWLQTVEAKHHDFLVDELTDLICKTPLIIESTFPPPFELGIDIGVAKDLSLWILDVNSKPGRKIVLETAPEETESMYTAPLGYSKWLAANHKKEGNSFENSLSN
ncbi:YheC/YheD family protein [Bacillus sp. B15-48]|uniref:YheC/YheD family endospore coat-associated protein n=1 Tax=Bacillus sp. B15-48 TaxID=1548601 RepID=UPI00193F4117|nr:YheC/YheD family protein [Bacillus sp. B15-48]MBM4764107.1 YheC/YheD family protein [Bacillus sp. B15-48]